ncbi:MAG: hypothetical protein FD139_3469 [Methylocystaceae bacterium]|nr:MAG: hypothetical protein FD139_3469 [Methylocystaceae bacterium]
MDPLIEGLTHDTAQPEPERYVVWDSTLKGLGLSQSFLAVKPVYAVLTRLLAVPPPAMGRTLIASMEFLTGKVDVSKDDAEYKLPNSG